MTGPQWLHLTTRGELDSVPARYAVPRLADGAELARLAAFRAAHPRVLVEMGEFGTWHALIREDSGGETFAARHTLGELLDRLAALLGGAVMARSEPPGRHPGMSGDDEDAALGALKEAWGGDYDEIWVYDGEWGAHHKDDAEFDAVTAATPDELDAALRADMARRGMQAPAAGNPPVTP